MAALLQIKNRILYFTNKVKLNFTEFYSLTIDTIKVTMRYKLQRVLVWNKKAAELSMLMRLFLWPLTRAVALKCERKGGVL